MPWCATCDRFLSPSTVHTDGACPACGATVEAGRAKSRRRLPRHLVVLAVAFALYLGYRLIQGLVWVTKQL